MPRYIDVDEICLRYDGLKHIPPHNFEEIIEYLYKQIRQQPILDVEKVIHAKWERVGQTCKFECSNCGRIIRNITGLDTIPRTVEVIDIWNEYPYCHCGAKMDL
jgi:hypothetical protein